ncbi:MAG: NAD(P)/FAD-dependent oxidoreductase [Synergistota bacterium]|nr:NAD(P)/FAD-dependent oxidoreductase [Synergistota bacterium]
MKNKNTSVNNIFDVVVIGGGPAGMMAASEAARRGATTALVEKNPEPGNKLLLTGKGRCNITCGNTDPEHIVRAFGARGKFLYSSLALFGVSDTAAFFESRGLPLIKERGDRLFPEKGNACSVLNILLEDLKRSGVTVKTGFEVVSVTQPSSAGGLFSVSNQSSEVYSRRLIVATGGCSFPSTGSNGKGYGLVEKLGHSIVRPTPSLVPVRTKETWVKKLQGLSLKNVSVSLLQGRKVIASRFGEMLFTHFGISGPIVMDMSKIIGGYTSREGVTLCIDLKPALSIEKLDKRLIRDFAANPGRKIGNSLYALMPRPLVPVILYLSGVSPEAPVDTISRVERGALCNTIKNIRLTPVSLLGFNWAIITSGGVNLKEINPATMESKIVPGLYVAGEMLDLDGPTGGYNLQECWSTGFVAGFEAGEQSLSSRA